MNIKKIIGRYFRRRKHHKFFKEQFDTLKVNIEEKTKLINEIQTHIQTLNDKKEKKSSNSKI